MGLGASRRGEAPATEHAPPGAGQRSGRGPDRQLRRQRRQRLAAVGLLLAFCGLAAGDPAHLDWERVCDTARRQLLLGQFDAARLTAGRGYEFWRGWPASPYHWQFRLALAEALIESDRLPEAGRLLASAPPARRLEARRQALLAQAHYRLRQYEDALRRMDAAEALAGNADAELLARTELTRGMLHLKLERYAQAEAAFRRGLAAVQNSGSLFEAYALIDLGHLDLVQFRYDEAIYWFQHARAVAERTGVPRARMLAAGNLGVSYFWLGDFDRALDLLGRAADASKGDRVYHQRWLALIGEVYDARQDYRDAIVHYQQARALAQPGVDNDWLESILIDIVEVDLEAGDVGAAEALNGEALRLAGRLATPSAFVGPRLAAARIAAARKQTAAAEAAFRLALATSREAHDPANTWRAHAGLAALYRGAGRADAAESEYRAAIAAIEGEFLKLRRDEWKFTFLGHLIRFYQDYVDFLVDRGQPARALEVAESCRARVLAQKLGGAVAATPFDVDALQRAVRGRRTVLMSYWLAPRRSLLWVVDSQGFRQFVLPDETRIGAEVARYTRALLRGEPGDDGHLFEVLVGSHYRPAAGSHMILVPDGSLHQLNFESLRRGGRYFVADATVAVAPSLALIRRDRAAAAPDAALVIGDPDFASEEFPRLPQLAPEVRMVAQHFPRRQVYTGAAATPDAYRQAHPERFSRIHFAAHAVASRESPLDSAIILAGRGEAHKLYARDVMAQPLRAGIVTLSACQTAAGRAYSGEGLISFAWAFLGAGARNVVAGLWDVDDRATAELMARFYDALAAGQPPAAALRRAKLALLAGPYRKPLYWAAFETFTTVLR